MKNKSAVLFVLGLMALVGVRTSYANTAKSYKLVNGLTGTGAVMVSTGPTILYSITMSSFGLTGSDFLLIRDTSTTNTSSALALPPIAPTLNNGVPGGSLTFNPPIQLRAGLNANLSVGVDSATIVYETGRY